MSTLIGKEACDFQATAVMPDNSINANFNLREYIKGYRCVLFFYPLDFTFVCPSELIALNNKSAEFANRKTKIVTVSVDSEFSHLAYKQTPLEQGGLSGIGNITFPMVADLTKSISSSYGVLLNQAVALRGTFIIDQSFIVRHESKNDLPLGRSISEILRLIDAIIFHQEHGEVCPANWKKGEPAMKPDAAGVAKYLTKNASSL